MRPVPTRIEFSPAMRTVALVFLLPTVVVGVAFWAQRAGLSDRGPLSFTTLVHTGFALASAWFASVLLGVLPQRLGPILADADGIKVPRIGRIDEYRWESLTITAHRMAADVSACLARDGDRKALFFCDDRSIAALRAGLQGVAAKESS